MFRTHTLSILFLVVMICQTGLCQKSNAFIESLLQKMTIQEKIGQLNLITQSGGPVTGTVISQDVEQKIMDGKVGGIFSARGPEKLRKIQELAVTKSRLGIPLITGMDVIHGHQTVLPIPLALSCSWNPTLAESCAQLAAKEATADGLMWNFSPMVDVSRDPRWGRIAESNGEDPYLSSEFARAYVRGYQGKDLKSPNTMMACVKHYAAYGAAEGGRDYATVDMSHVRLHNEYLPPYKAAVEEGVGSVMTSFNVVDYLPASANDYLYTTVLRNQWGFDGFVVTDYTAINEMIAHGIGDIGEVSAKALQAGIDMDMVGEGFLNTLYTSYEKGIVSEQQITEAARRILIAKEKLGLFEDPYRYFDDSRPAKDILTKENRTFARKVGGEVQVLLKNKQNILPLKKTSKIALIGPLADSRRNMMGTWSVSGDFDKSVTVIEGIKAKIGKGGHLLYAKGANISDDTLFARKVNVFGEEITIDKRSSKAMIEEAVKVSMQSDVIVAVMGEAADMSGEASSMADIRLQPSQRKLLEALKKTGKPIVLVLFNGRPMVLDWENKNVDAILDVWHTGIEAGNSIADVLFGDVNPSGKLTTSFPVSVGQIPVYHSMLNSGRPYNGEYFSKFKSNYLDIPNEPLFPFGFGLSYTSFTYGVPSISANTIGLGESVQVNIDITNTGSRDGQEVVQLYIRDLVGSISRPLKELKGFEKISIKKGETKTVTFTIDEADLSFYNGKLEFGAEPGKFEIMIGPNSQDVQKLPLQYTDIKP